MVILDSLQQPLQWAGQCCIGAIESRLPGLCRLPFSGYTVPPYMNTSFPKRIARLLLGLFLYAVGISATIKANIGYGPWEVFHAGLGRTVGMSIGTASILVGLAIIGITLLMGEKVGLGTVANMLLIGVFIDILLGIEAIPEAKSFIMSVLVLVAGLFTIALGSYFYIGSGFGAGPRDGLMLALTRRTKLPIGLIRGSIELAATGAGWLLGGMAGLGTVISGLGIGISVQTTFRLLKFDATSVRHSGFGDVAKELKAFLDRPV